MLLVGEVTGDQMEEPLQVPIHGTAIAVAKSVTLVRKHAICNRKENSRNRVRKWTQVTRGRFTVTTHAHQTRNVRTRPLFAKITKQLKNATRRETLLVLRRAKFKRVRPTWKNAPRSSNTILKLAKPFRLNQAEEQ